MSDSQEGTGCARRSASAAAPVRLPRCACLHGARLQGAGCGVLEHVLRCAHPPTRPQRSAARHAPDMIPYEMPSRPPPKVREEET